MEIRAAQDDDQQAIIALIKSVYLEYGEKLCLQGADADLLDISNQYLQKGGAFIVLEDRGYVVGSHATLPLQDREDACTFRRLYLSPQFRGQGQGALLMQWAIAWAKSNGFKKIEFWSDTRFERAHRFFTRLGFQKGNTRNMVDAFEPYQEYFFSMNLPHADLPSSED